MNDESRTTSTRTIENEIASKHGIDIAKETRELAAINPRVARELRHILDSGQQPAASPASPAPHAPASPGEKPPSSAKKSTPRRRRNLTPLQMHRDRCRICNSDAREEIDEAFISWEVVRQIANDFHVDRRIIYRHAHATGLYALRDRNIRRALGRIIQEADAVAPSADTVIRAIKMLTHINSRGEWSNPPTRVVFSTESRTRVARNSSDEVTHRAR